LSRPEFSALLNLESLLFKVYPNPNSGLFMLEINMAQTSEVVQEVKVEIINSLGQLFYQKVIPAKQGYVSEEIILESSMHTGIYFLKVSMGENVETNKIMLVR
jgi:hypothetical protein